MTTATGVGKVTGEIEVAEKDYEFFACGVWLRTLYQRLVYRRAAQTLTLLA